jgi:hypothetical protein
MGLEIWNCCLVILMKCRPLIERQRLFTIELEEKMIVIREHDLAVGGRDLFKAINWLETGDSNTNPSISTGDNPTGFQIKFLPITSVEFYIYISLFFTIRNKPVSEMHAYFYRKLKNILMKLEYFLFAVKVRVTVYISMSVDRVNNFNTSIL